MRHAVGMYICMCLCVYFLLLPFCKEMEKREENGSTVIVRAKCFKNAKDIRRPTHALSGKLAPQRWEELNGPGKAISHHQCKQLKEETSCTQSPGIWSGCECVFIERGG